MNKTKIGKGYFQAGYGRGLKKTATIYLINGKLYAKDLKNWKTDFDQLDGDLIGYVRVNSMIIQNQMFFNQVSLPNKHRDYQK
jgi:hypothetical protein